MSARLGLYSTPPFRDHIETLLYAYAFMLGHLDAENDLKISMALLSIIHIAKGLRWQLVPLYLSIGMCYWKEMIIVRTILTLFWILSGVLAFVVPFMPPVTAEAGDFDVGIQDFLLREPRAQHFWVRLYYPVTPEGKDKYVSLGEIGLMVTLIIIAIMGQSLEISFSMYFVMFLAIHLFFQGVEVAANVPRSQYMPDVRLSHTGLARYMKMPSLIFSHLPLMELCAAEDGVPADVNSPMKVVFMLHGLSGLRSTYSAACMRLAAEGYLVVSPEFGDGTPGVTTVPSGHRYYQEFRGTSNSSEEHQFRHSQLEHRQQEINVVIEFLERLHQGKSIDEMCEDIRWYRNKKSKHSSCVAGLRGKIEVNNFVLIGHSFGGATALYSATSMSDSAVSMRNKYIISSLILYDPWMFPLSDKLRHGQGGEVLHLPVLCMHAQLFQWAKNLEFESFVVRKSPTSIQVKLKDTGHVNYTENSLFAPHVSAKLRSTGRQDPLPILSAINEATVEFIHAIEIPDLKLRNIDLESLKRSLISNPLFELQHFAVESDGGAN
jgi:dienelactone hydrolase